MSNSNSKSEVIAASLISTKNDKTWFQNLKKYIPIQTDMQKCTKYINATCISKTCHLSWDLSKMLFLIKNLTRCSLIL